MEWRDGWGRTRNPSAAKRAENNFYCAAPFFHNIQLFVSIAATQLKYILVPCRDTRSPSSVSVHTHCHDRISNPSSTDESSCSIQRFTGWHWFCNIKSSPQKFWLIFFRFAPTARYSLMHPFTFGWDRCVFSSKRLASKSDESQNCKCVSRAAGLSLSFSMNNNNAIDLVESRLVLLLLSPSALISLSATFIH